MSNNGPASTSTINSSAFPESRKPWRFSLEVLRDGNRLTFTAQPGKFDIRIDNGPLPDRRVDSPVLTKEMMATPTISLAIISGK